MARYKAVLFYVLTLVVPLGPKHGTKAPFTALKANVKSRVVSHSSDLPGKPIRA
jgi:hypothetical protein